MRILDFAHALEYVSTAGQAAHEHAALSPQEPAPSQQDQAKRRQQCFEGWLKAQAHELKTGEAAVVLAELERLRTLMQELGQWEAVKTVDKSLHYLGQRQQMMRYAHFQAQGYPIGSGSVESAHKLVVQSRMKQAGMRWEPRHVNAMLAMRNLACNERWREGWLAIRQTWRTNARARRAERTLQPSEEDGRASPPPPTVLPHPEPAVCREPVPPSLSLTKQPPDRPSPAQPERRPVRPAPTHPWRRPFIRRRSA